MRYVMRIAEFSESSNLWTHVALPGTPGSISAWVSVFPTLPLLFKGRAEAYGISCARLWKRGRVCAGVLKRFREVFLHYTPRRGVSVTWWTNLWYNPCSLDRFGRVPLWVANFVWLEPESSMGGQHTNFRTSCQKRGPAEFKHITKRRKRN